MKIVPCQELFTYFHAAISIADGVAISAIMPYQLGKLMARSHQRLAMLHMHGNV